MSRANEAHILALEFARSIVSSCAEGDLLGDDGKPLDDELDEMVRARLRALSDELGSQAELARSF